MGEQTLICCYIPEGIVNAGNIYASLSDFITTTKKSHLSVKTNKKSDLTLLLDVFNHIFLTHFKGVLFLFMSVS